MTTDHSLAPEPADPSDRVIETTPPRSAWADFFSLTGGSILYCLSAMSVLYGISRLRGSHFASSEAIWPALPCLGALQSYELALLAVLFFVVVMRRVTDDAISLVVIMALFLIGGGLALTTVSLGSPRPAMVFGLLGFVLAIGKVETLRRFIRMGFTALMRIALFALLLWNGVIGGATALKASSVNISKIYWLGAWLIPLASTLLFMARHRKAPGLRIPGSLNALGALLMWGYQPDAPMALNWDATGVVLTAALYLAGWRKRSPALCLGAGVIVMLGLLSRPSAVEAANALGLTFPGLAFAVLGTTTLVTGLFFGHHYPRRYTFLGSLCCLVASLDIFAGTTDSGWVFGILIVQMAGIWLRNRDIPSILFLAMPFGYRACALVAMMREWLWVLLSFVLLFLGAMASNLKSRQGSRLQGEGSRE